MVVNQNLTKMTEFKFPIQFVFNVSSFSNDFTATDASGRVIAYVRQKMFKLKEDIIIFSDEGRTKENFRIRADKWIDFSTAYSIQDLNTGKELGKVARKGWRSLWKAEYHLIDQHQKLQYHIKEKNPWVRFWDNLIGEIPVVNFFTGYFLNPTYLVTNLNGGTVVELTKDPSFFGRKFTVTEVKSTDNDDDQRIVLGLMMMILLERRRG